MPISEIPDIRTLMETGMHFGHASGKWHPKMKPYIFATRDKLHIIDLEKTRQKLTEVLGLLEERIQEGKIVVLVGTKRQVSDRIKEIGEATGTPYVNVRWLGGTMTNFSEVQKSISRMKRTEAFLETEEASKMIKKERVRMEADLRRMHYKFSGLRDMNRKPDALFIIDPGYEHNAVKEARCEGIELFAIVDTNTNPDLVDHVIPANDDAPKALNVLLNLIEEAIKSGRAAREQRRAKEEKEAAAPVAAEVPAEPVAITPEEGESLDEIEEEVKEEVAESKQEAPPSKTRSTAKPSTASQKTSGKSKK